MMIFSNLSTTDSAKTGKPKKPIIFAAIGFLVVAILIVGVFSKISEKEAEPTTNAKSGLSEIEKTVTVDADVIYEETTEQVTTKEETIIKLEEPTTTKKSIKAPATKRISQQQTTEKIAKPVKPGNTVSPVTNGKFTEIIDNGNDSVKEYKCGVARHNCDSKESHSFIVSLEEKGCHHCGSHTCKSFYTVDEWGNTCYDQTKCPNYSAKKDPNEYCQECGKMVGSGSNNTCVRFTIDTKCPGCGKSVKGKTCHSH